MEKKINGKEIKRERERGRGREGLLGQREEKVKERERD